MEIRDSLAAFSLNFFWVLRGFYFGVLACLTTQLYLAYRAITKSPQQKSITTTNVDAEEDFPESIAKYLRDACSPTDASRVARCVHILSARTRATLIDSQPLFQRGNRRHTERVLFLDQCLDSSMVLRTPQKRPLSHKNEVRRLCRTNL